MSVFMKGLDSDISSLSKKPIAGKTRAIENISSVITMNDPKIFIMKLFFNFLSIRLKKILIFLYIFTISCNNLKTNHKNF